MLTLSWCAGLFIVRPGECSNEFPATSTHDIFLPIKEPIKCSTKAEFLKDWGKPDIIDSKYENTETWIYKRHLWCGVMPNFILPVPLLLPVCDGFDRIEFLGNESKRLHTRRTLLSGFLLLPPGPAGIDSACRYQIPPYHCMDSNEASPTTQVTPWPLILCFFWHSLILCLIYIIC